MFEPLQKRGTLGMQSFAETPEGREARIKARADAVRPQVQMTRGQAVTLMGTAPSPEDATQGKPGGVGRKPAEGQTDAFGYPERTLEERADSPGHP